MTTGDHSSCLNQAAAFAASVASAAAASGRRLPGCRHWLGYSNCRIYRADSSCLLPAAVMHPAVQLCCDSVRRSWAAGRCTPPQTVLCTAAARHTVRLLGQCLTISFRFLHVSGFHEVALDAPTLCRKPRPCCLYSAATAATLGWKVLALRTPASRHRHPDALTSTTTVSPALQCPPRAICPLFVCNPDGGLPWSLPSPPTPCSESWPVCKLVIAAPDSSRERRKGPPPRPILLSSDTAACTSGSSHPRAAAAPQPAGLTAAAAAAACPAPPRPCPPCSPFDSARGRLALGLTAGRGGGMILSFLMQTTEDPKQQQILQAMLIFW
jgi:hypothetical protein